MGSVESQSLSETVAEISRSSVTRAAAEILSVVAKFVTVTGNVLFAKTVISLQETNADDATQAKMEHRERRKCLKLAREIGIARCVTTITSHGERNANDVTQTKTELLEHLVGKMVGKEEVVVAVSEVDAVQEVVAVPEVVEISAAAVEAEVDLIVEDEDQEERLEAAVEVLAQTNPSVTRPVATKRSLLTTKLSFTIH